MSDAETFLGLFERFGVSLVMLAWFMWQHHRFQQLLDRNTAALEEHTQESRVFREYLQGRNGP